jgi:beta-xylosidase
MALAIVHSGVQNDSSKIDKVSTLGSVNLSQTSDYLYLRIDSMNDEYQFLYSVDNESDYSLVAKTKADGVISRKYTGANLGLYITSNGTTSDDFMDVDWVKYTAHERN